MSLTLYILLLTLYIEVAPQPHAQQDSLILPLPQPQHQNIPGIYTLEDTKSIYHHFTYFYLCWCTVFQLCPSQQMHSSAYIGMATYQPQWKHVPACLFHQWMRIRISSLHLLLVDKIVSTEHSRAWPYTCGLSTFGTSKQNSKHMSFLKWTA